MTIGEILHAFKAGTLTEQEAVKEMVALGSEEADALNTLSIMTTGGDCVFQDDTKQ